MGIGLNNLLCCIADEVGYHHKVGTHVDKHRDERVAEIVDADGLDFCLGALTFKIAFHGGLGERTVAAEKVGRFAPIRLQLLYNAVADRDDIGFICLGAGLLIDGSVERLTRDRRIEKYGLFLPVYLLGFQRKHLVLSSACKKECGKQCVIGWVIHFGYKLLKLFLCPDLHLGWSGAAFGQAHLAHLIRVGIAVLDPREKGGKGVAHF